MLAAERLHGDDTTVPILAKGKTVTGHIWTYVRDDRPFGGRHRRRRCITPRAIEGMSIPRGIFGTSPASCRPTPTAGTTSFTICRDLSGAITADLLPMKAAMRSTADIAANARRGKTATAISPVGLEAVKRIDALFDIDRGRRSGGRNDHTDYDGQLNDIDPQAWLADVLAQDRHPQAGRTSAVELAATMERRKMAA